MILIIKRTPTPFKVEKTWVDTDCGLVVTQRHLSLYPCSITTDNLLNLADDIVTSYPLNFSTSKEFYRRIWRLFMFKLSFKPVLN